MTAFIPSMTNVALREYTKHIIFTNIRDTVSDSLWRATYYHCKEQNLYYSVNSFFVQSLFKEVEVIHGSVYDYVSNYVDNIIKSYDT